MPYTYNPATGRYRDAATGRLVSEAAVRTAVDTVAAQASTDLAALTARLVAGEIRLAAWQAGAMATVKRAHVAAALAARGGKAGMTPREWGAVGARLRREYGYLRAWAGGMAEGTAPLDGRAATRASLYGQGTRVTYEAFRARDAAGYGYTEERSVLHPAEHCGGCTAEAGRGWAPLGTLVPIGLRQCLSNCRCTIMRRKARSQRARHLRAVV